MIKDDGRRRMWIQGKGLNVRPFPPSLREELRDLAEGAGQSLYAYVIAVLRRHVHQQVGASTRDAKGSAAKRRTST